MQGAEAEGEPGLSYRVLHKLLELLELRGMGDGGTEGETEMSETRMEHKVMLSMVEVRGRVRVWASGEGRGPVGLHP